MKYTSNLCLLVLVSQLHAQTSNEMQYGAYLKVSKSMWEKSITLAEQESGKASFEKAVAMYGLLNSTMAREDEETFDEYLDHTVELLKSIIELNPESGEPKAVLSSVYGLVMAYSPWKGMLYGSRSSSLMAEAVKDDPDSPLVQKLYAGSKLYTPSMWGGSPEKAVEGFNLSVSIYEQSQDVNNWLYLDALMGLALAYKKTDDVDNAKVTLDKLVDLEPQHYWAKSVRAKLDSE